MEGELVAGRGRTSWIEWQDDTSRLRAIDQTRFYGFYCLVFEERATLANLPRLRSHMPSKTRQRSVVDMVSQDDGSTQIDPDVIDRLTGKIRRRTDVGDAGPGTTGGRTGTGRTGTGTGTTTPRMTTGAGDSDPLRGLEL